MTVNLDQLDRFDDREQAIAALDKFIAELVGEFVVAAEGKAYLQSYPEIREYVGSWIDHLLYFGYAYESVTLPQMTVSNVEAIVICIFPHKISLLDPNEADTAISELTAFWEFLQREYQLTQAPEIIKFLNELQPKFSEIMAEFQNSDIAQNLSILDLAAGFDLSTKEIAEFQSQSDRQYTADSIPHQQKIGGLFDELAGLKNESLSKVEHTELAATLQALATEVVSEFSSEVPSALEFQRQLQADMTHELVQKMPVTSSRTILMLETQTITATEPGTILQDFATLLNFIGDGIEVSGKRHWIPMKLLAQLNQQLSEPLQINLQRPQQKSYPSIHGLYLLLRATGIGRIIKQGKKSRLTLDSAMVEQWFGMNPTEQYLNLLETWLIRANEEMLGERGSSFNEGFKCLQYWSRMSSSGERFKDYQAQQNLRYYPEFYNLALMKLFGLVEANYGKPKPGKGWRVKSVKQTDWGKAIIQALLQNFTDSSLFWDDSASQNSSFGQLQPMLQPYFPQWQQLITLPKVEPVAGLYVFKVSWHQIWRRIAVSSDMTLWDLSQLILQSVDFDADHLDLFSYKDRLGKTVRVVHPYMEESPATDETKIIDLPLEVGSVMEYLFDFGDNWEFELQLEEIKPDDLHTDYGEIIASHGQAPAQYPDWSED